MTIATKSGSNRFVEVSLYIQLLVAQILLFKLLLKYIYEAQLITRNVQMRCVLVHIKNNLKTTR